jgi:hypothetical protein
LAGLDKNTGGVLQDQGEWTGRHSTFAGRRVDLAATARAFAVFAPILEALFLEGLEQQVRWRRAPLSGDRVWRSPDRRSWTQQLH